MSALDSLRNGIVRAKFNRPPVVIGGCGRSGTTLLLAIVSAHPEIYAIPFETAALCPGSYSGDDFDTDVDLDLTRLYRALPMKRELFTRRRRFAEKTPRNVLFFPAILSAFRRRVRLVHIVRDGRDVVTSRHPKDPDAYWVSPDRWVSEAGAGLKMADDPRVLTIRYEDLVGGFEETLRQLMAFIGEELPEEVLDFRRHATVRKGPWVRNPELRGLYSGSIGRWKRDEHAERVKQLMADPKAVELLELLGYET